MTSKRITDRSFFLKSSEELAKALIGKILCHEVGEGDEKFVIKVRIKVTEAYRCTDECLDENRSKKPTTQRLSGGHLHYHNAAEGRKRIDIVANEADIPESVLIAETDLYDGPQKTLWALDLESSEYDGLDLTDLNAKVWLEDDGTEAVLNPAAPRKNVEDPAPLRFSAKEFCFK